MRILLSIRTALFAFLLLAMSTASFGQVGISITIGPPPLPVYEQPLCPGEGYLWTPGYWAYDYDFNDYYWVPGTWVLAPEVGYFWTPAYWAWNGGRFVFYDGYWGPQVGFYGGIDYGYGYFGNGYEGGRWDHDRFFYNRSVNNVNVTVIHNVYNTTVVNRTTVNRVSYNGGNGGIDVRPTREQEAAARERHIAPVAVQTEHMQAARRDPEQRASVNRGKPAIAASPRPADFKDRVPAREAGGPYTPPANREGGQRGNGQNSAPANNDRNDRPRNAIHPNDLPRGDRPTAPNTGNPKRDQRAERDQQKMMQKQDTERGKLQQKQDQEHQRLDRQKADDSKRQAIEQQHQQQTQKLEQRQNQQQQKWQEKHQPADRNQPRPPQH